MDMELTVGTTDFMQFLAPGGLTVSRASRGNIEIEYLDGSIGTGRKTTKKQIDAATRLLTMAELQTVKSALHKQVVTVTYRDPWEGGVRHDIPMKVSDFSAGVTRYGSRIMCGPVSFTLTEV